MITIYQHPTCSTCKKARAWFDQEQIPYELKDIREEAPDKETIKQAFEAGNLTLRRIFNTSGNLYKEMQLKDKLDDMSIEDALDLLQSDGMLIRRPFITDGKNSTFGFKEEEFETIWK
ncbi:transcriptional regulator spx/mgsr [Trichococcus palustris]|jgi:arsenate reductase (glutaredoxin)|uniref:Transcriptional regulator spx/mgsr n=1 Tax=Trichococcus palustris TaxID=140314 RepID=A0A143YPS0_9LACT|nr:arsenate reductase family protein [Trichococcus palustris]CZQ95441.1 transcriptional regulator spx/mgsr [Trichococcus palustris]SFK96628.1 arsenate reductase [Trichococcus palustris]